jgi:o-succinylbenzoate---CoA ligase
VNELVCLDMPSGQAFVDRLTQAWSQGDAVFPLDQRLPQRAREIVLKAVRPTVIATTDGDRIALGHKVETGDALVVATSGTTGAPKAAILTHDAVAASATATSQRLGVTTDDCWLACLPASHVGGLSVITRALLSGTRLITHESFSEKGYIEAAKQGATLVSLVATALQRVDASLYRTIVLGGAKPPADRPANCVTTYGMTETGSGVFYDGVALDDVEIRITDSMIYLRAPMLMRGYRFDPAPIDSDGWFCTGDLGELDAHGVLSVHGRQGDLIISGGENIWPEAVEDALRTLTSVEDVCVVGLPDAEWGQQVCAFVVPHSVNTPTLEEVRNHVKETLPAFCAPKQLQLVTAIPRTALGKPQRQALAERYCS